MLLVVNLKNTSSSAVPGTVAEQAVIPAEAVAFLLLYTLPQIDAQGSLFTGITVALAISLFAGTIDGAAALAVVEAGTKRN